MSLLSALRAGRLSTINMRPKPSARRHARRLRVEPLEKRELLDAAGLPATIDGSVFEDLDFDNVQDVGEPGLADWSVELTPTGGDHVRSHFADEGYSLGGTGAMAIEGGRYLVGMGDINQAAQQSAAGAQQSQKAAEDMNALAAQLKQVVAQYQM